ncbi:MAG TPA: hypothetical protein VFO91_10970 [Anaerolineales bacterium]|nr:hypothetical protein [Anaerolineales bacterium]
MQKQLCWGGLLIIVASLLMNGMNILVYSGYDNVTIQAVYGAGFTGLVLAATIIHIAQSRRAGVFGLLAYLVSVLSLVYANVVTFLILAELSGIEGAQQTLAGIWEPLMRISVYGIFVGWTLLGISIAQAGVLPRWAGILVAGGVAFQLPAQYAMEMAGSLFFLFTIGGSILFGAGLIWIGWALWSGKGWQREEPGLSNLDGNWGGLVVIFTGFMLAVDASVNMFGGLSLASGITHLVSYTTILLTAFLLYAAHGERASWAGFAGFLFAQLGAALYMITAFLVVAQLAGAIEDNRMLMATWEDIPVGRIGSYLVLLGMFLLGIEAILSQVFPRWTGWLVVVGIALALPFAFTIQAYYLGIFWVLGAALEGIGVAWMGWTLLSKRPADQIVQLSFDA